ncbi:MAG TPA: hypothetical protein VFX89_21150 [Gammaproteobacteria bacterium]|nr:hypothetical protein [Gammaproteobacteria bacterium]
MSIDHPFPRFAAATVCCAVVIAWAHAAAADSPYDIHYLSEHVPESGMDAHYQSLPWPGGRLTPGRWQTSLDLSNALTRTDFIDLDGSMIAFAAGTGVNARWGYELVGFDSEMHISGAGGRADLDAGFVPGMPLHLPALAEYPDARGTLRQLGIGAAAVREGRAKAPSSAQLIVGALLERVDVAGFELDYRLLNGPDAGVTGTLDHSTGATYFTPFVEWQQTRALAHRWSWSPRALLALPLPAGDFAPRLSGPGFDVTVPSSQKIGDPFATFGLALTHRPSGLEIDLGGMLFYSVAEHVSHPGVDRAVLTHVAWHWGAGSGAAE